MSVGGVGPGKTELTSAAGEGMGMTWDLPGLLPPRPLKPAMRFEELARPAGKAIGTIGHPARRARQSQSLG